MTKADGVSAPASDLAKADPQQRPVPVLLLADQLRLDELIVSAASTKWCKIALLMSQVTDAAKSVSFEVAPQSIAARIYVLADIGILSVQGNVRRWRAGEVKRA